jgi:hypothetical protein
MDPSRQPVVEGFAPPAPGPRPTQRHTWSRFLLFAGTFLLGVVVGGAVLLLSALSISNDNQPLPSSTSSENGAITVQVRDTYIAQIVKKNLSSSDLPGTISNVQVTLGHDGQMTVTGDDQLQVLGIGTTKHFRVLLQILAHSCQFQVHVLRADLEGIPVTGFVSLFESQVNGQLQAASSSLPSGFEYCATEVTTKSHELVVTYSVRPQ